PLPAQPEHVPHLRGWTPWALNPREGIARGSGCFLCGKCRRQVPLSRRDILRIARRFNAGKHRASLTSPERTAEGWGVGLDLKRPFGTRHLFASKPSVETLFPIVPSGQQSIGLPAQTKRPRCL